MWDSREDVLGAALSKDTDAAPHLLRLSGTPDGRCCASRSTPRTFVPGSLRASSDRHYFSVHDVSRRDSRTRGRSLLPPMTDDRQTRERELAELLRYLHESRGLDLSGYKRVGLLRRLTKRMRTVGVEGFGAYQSYIETHPTEYTGLLDTLLINVTAFFRDDLPWEYLRNEIVPLLLEQKGPTDAIRVWCAGCATGEEAYSLAIVLAEALGIEQFQERVKLYATDLDNEALAKARLGAYGERDLAEVPAPIVEKYFDHRDQTFYFRKDLRRCVIFGRNDLVQDAPISRVDLLACRNTLMYFDGPTQAKILARFHFALNEGGFLFLGRAETMLTHATMFTPMDLRRRVFTKSRFPGVERIPLSSRAISPRGGAAQMPNEPHDTSLRLRSFDVGTVPQFVIDETGRLFLVNARARVVFRLAAADIGRPLQDLEISYRPYELALGRSSRRTPSGSRSVRDGVSWRGARRRAALVRHYRHADVRRRRAPRRRERVVHRRHARPAAPAAARRLAGRARDGVSGAPVDERGAGDDERGAPLHRRGARDDQRGAPEHQRGARDDERGAPEHERGAADDQRRAAPASDSLNDLNTFLESMFTSLRSGIAVLDRDLRVTVWNRQAEELWGVRAAEVEQVHFLRLDIGLPLDQIENADPRLPRRQDRQPRGVPARRATARGRAIVCKTRIYPLVTRDDARPRGVIVLMDEMLRADGIGADGRRSLWPSRRSEPEPKRSSRRSAASSAAGTDGLEAERLMTEHRLADQFRSLLRLARLFEETRILRRGDTPVPPYPMLAGARRLAEEDDASPPPHGARSTASLPPSR